MAQNSTVFVAMPLLELLDLFRAEIQKEFLKFKQEPSSEPAEGKLLNIEEACALLHVSKVTIHKWKKQKLIFSHRIGRKIYFKKEELLQSLFSSENKKNISLPKKK